MAFISGLLTLGTGIVSGAVVPPTATPGYVSGYAPQAISYDRVTGGLALNVDSAQFGPVSGDWGTLVAFGITDLSGNPAWTGTLEVPLTPDPNEYVIAPAGQMPIRTGTQLSVSAGNVLIATGAVSRTQLLVANTTPVDIVSAPGAGKIAVPTSATVAYSVGSETFARAAAISFVYAGDTGVPLLQINAADSHSNGPFQGTRSQTFFNIASVGNFNSEAVNQVIQFMTDIDLGAGIGPVATIEPNGDATGGAFECPVVGDTGAIPGGDNTATFTVDAIDNVFAVLNWNVGTRSFTIGGNHTALFTVNQYFSYSETPGTVRQVGTVALSGGNTVFSDAASTVGASSGYVCIGPVITAVSLVDDGNGYLVANNVVCDITGSGGRAYTSPINITAVTDTPPTDSGNAVVTVNYTIVDAPT